MAFAHPSIPSISISLALPDDPPVEPFSPFDMQSPSTTSQEDTYRPSLLSPPPVLSPRFHRQPSPLRPADTLSPGKGLDRGQFEALLASTRERNASAKKEPNLRKELALKAHKSKQSTLLHIVLSCPCSKFFQWNVAHYFSPRSMPLPHPPRRVSQKHLPSRRLSSIIPCPPRASFLPSRYSSLCNKKILLHQSINLLSSRGLSK
jgi:hypothetical protein